MRITTDLHTHTQHSHGTGTVEDNVRAAIALGLKQIAITDHGVGHLAYGVRDVERYLKDIDNAKQKFAGSITVKSGIELNLLNTDGELDLPRGYEKSFDLLLFGFHKFARFTGFGNMLRMFLPKSTSDRAVFKNTQGYLFALRQYPIDIVTHVGYGLPCDIPTVAQCAAEHQTMIEINAKHPEFTVDELNKSAQSGVMFCLNSDAHSPERVGDIAASIQKAQEAGLPVSRIYGAEEEPV